MNDSSDTPSDARLVAFQRRVLQDALAEGTARYWNRRAHVFAAVGTPAADEVAQACRNAALVAVMDPRPDLPPLEPLEDADGLYDTLEEALLAYLEENDTRG